MAKHSQIRFEYRDDYEWIRVIDVYPEEHRHLHFENSIQGVMSLDNHASPVLEYINIMAYGVRALFPQPKKVYLGGLGTCSLHHTLTHWWRSQTQIMTWENNERVLELAQKFFRLEPAAKVAIGDFRQKLQGRRVKEADLIFVDCYSAESVPAHLTTVEFMQELSDKLTPGGAAIFNIWSPSCNEFCGYQLKTILEVFPEIAAVMCRKDDNVIVFAQKKLRNDWPEALVIKDIEYPLLTISRDDPDSWPDFMADVEIIRDDNVYELFAVVGLDF